MVKYDERKMRENTMNMKNFIVKPLAFLFVFSAFAGVSVADTGRASFMGNATARAGSNVNTARMPTMPIVSMNTIGNPAVSTVSQPVNTNTGIVIPTPEPEPEPEPGPTPPTPPTPECPDGGVRNTPYTVDMCMAELSQCINIGGVSNGMHGLFNEDFFNQILNGSVRICQQVVDKCLTIRKDCHKVYKKNKAVWLDFRVRILQPEYYNFVLYRTGLTPNQAEKTCFAIGGRWDAVNGDCLIHVVAYNKDKPISNEWLFGIAGNGKDADAWLKTGEAFTCNKSLFGFSLMNNTATVAATAIPGAAIVGGTVGGIVAKNRQNRAMANPCSDKSYRKELGKKIKTTYNDARLQNYLYEAIIDEDTGDFSTGESRLGAVDFYDLTEEQCDAIIDLYSKAKVYDEAIKTCEANAKNKMVLDSFVGGVKNYVRIVDKDGNQVVCTSEIECVTKPMGVEASDINKFNDECLFIPLNVGFLKRNIDTNPFCNHQGACESVKQIKQELNSMRGLLAEIEVAVSSEKGPSVGKGILVGAAAGAAAGGVATAITAVIESSNIKCKVGSDLASVSLNKSYTIGSLKDFYVKRGLNLPDTVLANTPVVDKTSWGVACSEFQGNFDDCQNASVIYKHDNKREVISYACIMQGSMCLMNQDLAELYGVN